jgi:hypothetical protein
VTNVTTDRAARLQATRIVRRVRCERIAISQSNGPAANAEDRRLVKVAAGVARDNDPSVPVLVAVPVLSFASRVNWGLPMPVYSG